MPAPDFWLDLTYRVIEWMVDLGNPEIVNLAVLSASTFPPLLLEDRNDNAIESVTSPLSEALFQASIVAVNAAAFAHRLIVNQNSMLTKRVIFFKGFT